MKKRACLCGRVFYLIRPTRYAHCGESPRGAAMMRNPRPEEQLRGGNKPWERKFEGKSRLYEQKLHIRPDGWTRLEQWASGGERGPWSDLYSLGATCYRLITGLEPPDCHDRVYADSDASLLSERRELLGRFSPALLAGIDRAFRMNPAERWQNARVWLKDLSGGSRENVSRKKTQSAADCPSGESAAC